MISAAPVPASAVAHPPATDLVRLHVGLYVADLARASAFFRVLFNAEPKKDYADHVHFESDDPPVILALSPGGRRPGGALNHIGLRLTSAATLVEIQKRLEKAGHRTQRQEGVACCYAQQTKFWVTDPDYNLWEIYVLETDLNRHGFEEPPRVAPPPAVPVGVVWEHKNPDPVPERIPHADGSVDEVRLLNSFNGAFSEADRVRLLAEAFRVLRPGGALTLAGLVADRPVAGDPNLPGLGSRMKRVPVETEPLFALRAAGFVDLFCHELADIHCFTIPGVELRKLRLAATRPASAGELRYEALYRGPFHSATDDDGRVYVRGQRVPVPADVWQRLHDGPAKGQFQFFAVGANSPG